MRQHASSASSAKDSSVSKAFASYPRTVIEVAFERISCTTGEVLPLIGLHTVGSFASSGLYLGLGARLPV